MQALRQLFAQVQVEVDLLLLPGPHIEVPLTGTAVGVPRQGRIPADGVVQEEIQIVLAIAGAEVVGHAVGQFSLEPADDAEIGVVAVKERGETRRQTLEARRPQGPEVGMGLHDAGGAANAAT